MKKLLLFLFIGSMCFGQNPTRFMYGIAPANIVPYSPNAGVGINTTTPQAILDVVSTSSGILIPRMTTTQKNAIVSPTTSMQLFDTTIQKFQYWNGTNWISYLNDFAKDITNLDLNTLTDLGFYVGGTLTNAPESDILGSYFILVEKDNSNDFIKQTATTQGSSNIRNKTFTRVYNGTWSDWKLLVSQSDIDTSIATADANLVHKTGDETIAGIKTFNDKLFANAGLEVTGLTRHNSTIINAGADDYYYGRQNLVNGANIIGYSDGGTTEKFRLDASNGTATFTGTVSGADATASNHFVTKGQSDVFVPLSGTDSGSPISGDLELQNETSIFSGITDFQSSGDEFNVTGLRRNQFGREIFVGINSGDNIFESTQFVDVDNYSTLKNLGVNFFESGVNREYKFLNDNFLISSTNSSFKGFVGAQDYTPNLTPLAYPQKIYVDNKTGWAVYQDTAYTIGSPFTILTGVTSTLPNNAGTVINTQIPTGVTSYYDNATNKITPANNGDYYTTTIRFKATTTAPTAGYFDFGIDIGGALGVQFKETKIFAKGAGIEHNFSVVVPMYSGATFIANGGLVKITSGNGNMSVYDINYHVDLVHKAK